MKYPLQLSIVTEPVCAATRNKLVPALVCITCEISSLGVLCGVDIPVPKDVNNNSLNCVCDVPPPENAFVALLKAICASLMLPLTELLNSTQPHSNHTPVDSTTADVGPTVTQVVDPAADAATDTPVRTYEAVYPMSSVVKVGSAAYAVLTVLPADSVEDTWHAPTTSSVVAGVAVPIPTRLFELSTLSVVVSTVIFPATVSEDSGPKEVSEEEVIPDPKVFPLSTATLLILYVCPVDMLIPVLAVSAPPTDTVPPVLGLRVFVLTLLPAVIVVVVLRDPALIRPVTLVILPVALVIF